MKLVQKNTGGVRINAGQWRGQKLIVLDQVGLRPTGDRIKQTLFNWLQQQVGQACCLDLFAGSGVLGFEALSRGAYHCVFVEVNSNVAKQLQFNIEKFQKQGLAPLQASLYVGQAQSFLEKEHQDRLFNLVFIDPPFELMLHHDICFKLEQSGLLARDAMIYIECAKEQWPIVVPEHWLLLKQKNIGQVYFALYQRNNGA